MMMSTSMMIPRQPFRRASGTVFIVARFPTRKGAVNSNYYSCYFSSAQTAPNGSTAAPSPASTMSNNTNNKETAAITTFLGASAAIVATSFLMTSSSPAETQKSPPTNGSSPHDKKLEVHLMDRIAKKPYLSYNSVPMEYSASLQSRRLGRWNGRTSTEERRDVDSGKDRRDESSHRRLPPPTRAKSYGIDSTKTTPRPKGVPHRMRLLTIDVPRFKDEAFDHGICVLPSQLFGGESENAEDGGIGPKFLDGVAPSKRQRRKNDHHEAEEEQDSYSSMSAEKKKKKQKKFRGKPIVQKSLAKELYYCYDSRWNEHQKRDLTEKKQVQQQQQHQHVSKDNKAKKSTTTSATTTSSSSSSSQQAQRHYPKVGVEILEASISSLNPNNIRRTYTSHSSSRRGGNWKKDSYRYDPGKYTSSEGLKRRQQQQQQQQHYNEKANDEVEDESGFADVEEAEVEEEKLSLLQSRKSRARRYHNDDYGDDDYDDDMDEEDCQDDDSDNSPDETDAPWNQYAWLEEMHLRINGLVPFGQPMKRASPLSQWIYGRIYAQTIPATSKSNGWFSWLLPWMWMPSSFGTDRKNTASEGVDGEGESPLYGENIGIRNDGAPGSKSIFAWLLFPWSLFSSKHHNDTIIHNNSNNHQNNNHQNNYHLHTTLNRASNKPHAVIADGSAMQRVPGSLRYLIKTCRDANVPLYILNDPRSWGSNTHSTLSDALADMRKTIPANIVRRALDLREGSAFERGRMVGRWEREVAWQAWDAGRKTREKWKAAKEEWRREKREDWSELGKEGMRKKLVERKVIVVAEGGGDGDGNSSRDDDDRVRYADGFLELCRDCIDKENEMEPKSKQTSSKQSTG